MSDTPKVDEFVNNKLTVDDKVIEFPISHYIEFAAQLERELAAMKAQRDRAIELAVDAIQDQLDNAPGHAKQRFIDALRCDLIELQAMKDKP